MKSHQFSGVKVRRLRVMLLRRQNSMCLMEFDGKKEQLLNILLPCSLTSLSREKEGSEVECKEERATKRR